MHYKPKYNPKIHKRKSIRLKGYDYSQAGLYFITICCQDRICRFGQVVNGEMVLNEIGKMVESEWMQLPERFQNTQLHEFVVMPNHFHAILEIVKSSNTITNPPNAGATLMVDPNTLVVDTTNKTQAQDKENQPQEGQPVRTTLVVDPKNSSAETNPQEGTSPTVNPKNQPKQEETQPQEGQPQGIAHTAKTAREKGKKVKTVGEIVGAFQSIVTVKYIRGVKTKGWPQFKGKLWQRNFYEHIIRNERAYHNISKYIINNPRKWSEDKFCK
ncbi:transposase [Peijinzhouia sedimentorum]